MLAPSASPLVTYTTTVEIIPQNIVTILDPDAATMLVLITAESGADSSATTSEDILDLLIDDNFSTGSEVIFSTHLKFCIG